MAKIILICGKICSGKSYYANQIKNNNNAVILSIDEATYDLINNEQNEFFNVFAKRVNNYLRKKAVQIVKSGANVILDWGFWSKSERKEMTQFCKDSNIEYEWHYINISNDMWKKNILQRNQKVLSGNGGSDFYLDEGLINKLKSLFEVPQKQEIDVWHNVNDVF